MNIFFKKVKNNDNLYRNSINNSIINTDMEDFTSYQEEYKKIYERKQESTEIQNMKCELNCLKNNINEIKQLLHDLTHRNI